MTDFFKYKTPNFEKLRASGFVEEGGDYVYRTELLEGQFALTVSISQGGTVKTELMELAFGEPYTLHLVEDAVGEFVGNVREEFSRVMSAIADTCFERKIFQSEQANALIAHARDAYGSEPEYLWEKFPENAIWRRSDNAKWYGLMMTVPRKKLGLNGEGNVEILDVRADPQEIELLVDNKRYFLGWHMNKKHWLTVPLDGTLETRELFELLEESYYLANK